ncbi:mitochondrial glycoprotein [Cladochytrium replicatum]|nr:mitochondrial glycoprotein [Cladochytrium replicatum]
MFFRSIAVRLSKSALANPVAPRVIAPLRLAVTRPAFSATFSTSHFNQSHGRVDVDLAQKLSEELVYEKGESNESDAQFLETLKNFESRGIWKIEDKAGEKEVTMTRTYGNEKISVILSTDAINEQDIEEGEEAEGFPVSLTILVEKSGSDDRGALEITATSQEGSIYIENVAYNKSSALAADTSAEGDWQRRGKYGGPIFTDIDEELQDLFHKYIEERGIDTGLSEFIPEYLEKKEQKEYMNWLGSIKGFVEK